MATRPLIELTGCRAHDAPKAREWLALVWEVIWSGGAVPVRR